MSNTLKIMLVESDKGAAFSTAAALRSHGWEVVSSSDAIHALNVGVKEKPQVIVLSSHLPGGSGVQVLQRLRSLVHCAVTPVIGLADSPVAREKMLVAGAQECLSRPVDLEALCQAVLRQSGQTLQVTEAPRAVLADHNRIAALQETGLLDSPPTELYDQLTWLASKLLAVPTATVTLVDTDRQFFKSHIGLPEHLAVARQTPLSHSFCQWVVAGQGEVVVEDARQHQVLRDNHAVRDLNVIAYAGIPIALRPHAAVGSFCAIDSTPHPWRDEDLWILRKLAAITEAYAASHIDKGDSNADRPHAILALAQGIAAAVSLIRRPLPRLEAKGREVLLGAIEAQSERLVSLTAAR